MRAAVNAVFIVTVVLRGLIADRFDLKRRGNEQRGGYRDLSDHKHARNDVGETAAIAASAFLHHFGGVRARTDERGHETGNDRGQQNDAKSESENFSIDRELHPVRQRKRKSVCGADEQTNRPLRH